MKVPGSNLDVTLKSSHVQVCDGRTTKRIKIGGRSFDDVLSDLQRFAYLRGARAPRSILKYVLTRIGLPKVKVIPKTDQLTKEDIAELARALNDLEKLKDVYLAPGSKIELEETLKKHIARFYGKEEVPIGQEIRKTSIPSEALSSQNVPTPDEVVNTVFSFHPENIPKEAPLEREPRDKSKPGFWESLPDGLPEIKMWMPTAIDGISIDELPEGEIPLPSQIEELMLGFPEGEVFLGGEFPEVKVLILGEEGVGKRSLLIKGGFLPVNAEGEEDFSAELAYVFGKTIEEPNECVDFKIWQLEQVMQAGISRSHFYAGTSVLMIVYSVADRWSFESLEFWIKEASTSFLITPPIVIVANKTDTRGTPIPPESGYEEPVSTDEGVALAEKLAQELGENDQAHPVEFFETSCATGEGVDNVFKAAVELWLRNEKVSLPVVEKQITPSTG